jgi:hypothetical protein
MPPSFERCPACDGSLRGSEPSGAPALRTCLSCGHGVRDVSPAPIPWRDGAPVAQRPTVSWEDVDLAIERLRILRGFLPSGGRLLDLPGDPGLFADLVAITPCQVFRTPLDDLDAHQTFDAVTLWSGLESSPTPVADVGRIRPHVRVGGILIVAVPGPDHPAPALHRFSQRSVRLVLQRAGFDIFTQQEVASALPAPVETLLEPFRSLTTRFRLWPVATRPSNQDAAPGDMVVAATRR